MLTMMNTSTLTAVHTTETPLGVLGDDVVVRALMYGCALLVETAGSAGIVIRMGCGAGASLTMLADDRGPI